MKKRKEKSPEAEGNSETDQSKSDRIVKVFIFNSHLLFAAVNSGDVARIREIRSNRVIIATMTADR